MVGGIVHRVVVKVLEEVAFEVCFEEDPPSILEYRRSFERRLVCVFGV